MTSQQLRKGRRIAPEKRKEEKSEEELKIERRLVIHPMFKNHKKKRLEVEEEKQKSHAELEAAKEDEKDGEEQTKNHGKATHAGREE